MKVICPDCGLPVQRQYNGTLLQGLNQHRKIVHKLPGLRRLPVGRAHASRPTSEPAR